MSKLSTYLLVIFMIMFWVFRIIVTIAAQMGGSFLDVVPINNTFEIAILFATLVCLIFVIKRNIIGPLLYLTLHAIYFGGDITNKLSKMSIDGTLSLGDSMGLFFSVIGIVLPLAVLVDLLLDKNRKNNPKDKKTDWFYQNEQFDRKLDDRADKNNYRTM